MTFCSDTDLLYWEPDLFNAAAAAAQTLLSGVAAVSGAAVTLSGVSLPDAQVKPLGVISFTGSTMKGCYPIVSVDSDTTLTLSVLYDDLFRADGTPTGNPAAHAGDGLNQPFAIRTFYPQRRIVTQMLLQAAGVDPDGPEATGCVINAEALRRPCVLGTLQMIYSALAASAAEPAKLSARADLYERLYRRAMRCAQVQIDTDADGQADVTRPLNALRLIRG